MQSSDRHARSVNMECGRSLASISASSIDLKRIQTPHSIFREFGILEQIPLLQLVGQASNFEHLPVIWQSLLKAISEDNSRFRLKINGQALGAAFCQSLCWLDKQALTQGVS